MSGRILILLRNRILTPCVVVLDHVLSAVLLPIVLSAVVMGWPYLRRRRTEWVRNGRGSRHAMDLTLIDTDALRLRGTDHLRPQLSAALTSLVFLDPAAGRDEVLDVGPNLKVLTWRRPALARFLFRHQFAGLGTLVSEITVLFRLAGFVAEKRIGVVRADFHHLPALRGALLRRVIGVPLIIDVCGNYELLRRLIGFDPYFARMARSPLLAPLARALGGALLSWPFRVADAIIGRNKNNYEHAFALGAPVERLSLVRIRAFSQRYLVTDARPFGEPLLDSPYLLVVGRLSPEKYPLDAIEAFDMLTERFPDIHLVIVGGGPLLDAVRTRAACSSSPERVHVIGDCDHETTYRWTANATVALAHYSGASLVEAMLCRVPIVAYDIEWHAEMIIDGYTGLLAQFRNTVHLAAQIGVMVRDRERSREMADRARDLALRAFDPAVIDAREAAIYRTVLGGGPGDATARESSSPARTG